MIKKRIWVQVYKVIESDQNPKENEKKKDKYNYCNKEGHWKIDCPKLNDKNEKFDNASNAGYSISVAKDSFNDANILLIFVSSSRDSWIFDLVCSYHMYPHQDWLFTYHPIGYGIVLKGNNMSCKVVCTRTIRIKMHDSIVRILSNVRHVLYLKNLIFFSTLDSYNFNYSRDDRILKVSKSAFIVLKDKLSHGLYLL